jgi:hypothetical protein
MVKFGFKDYEVEIPNWSKHHRTLSVLVKRVYKEGEEIGPEGELLKRIVLENEDNLKSKHVSLRGRETNEHKEATDYYLQLQNREYEETNLDYYSVGAMNTRQTTYIRLFFQLEYDRFVLEYSFKSEGSHAMNFQHLMNNNGVEDIIDEILEKELPIEEAGIVEGEEKGSYHIILVTHVGEAIDVDVEKRELLNSLVGVEVYKFDHEIVD